ncbi:MAG: Aminodeoxychorismate synthase component 2 [Chlamydiae bacterium]|nr:Aminodeoxychorismate synthase component 2 [Chlamydiota bacterium]
MLLLIDNFDSFTYNIVQALEMLEVEVLVVRNNARTADEFFALNPQLLLIGPGPGGPAQAGISKKLINRFDGSIPILGVCLGHQCIAEAYGASIVRAAKGPKHGKTSEIIHQGVGVFSGLPQRFLATRYHSLVVDRNSLPAHIDVTAETADGEIMGIRHRNYPIEGVQFHPESILTEAGMQLFRNFINNEPI